MEYRRLVEIYDRLDATSSTLEKTDILADAFVDADELLPEFTQLARGRLFASWESDDLGPEDADRFERVERLYEEQ